jgi:hypothetical protein
VSDLVLESIPDTYPSFSLEQLLKGSFLTFSLLMHIMLLVYILRTFHFGDCTLLWFSCVGTCQFNYIAHTTRIGVFSMYYVGFIHQCYQITFKLWIGRPICKSWIVSRHDLIQTRPLCAICAVTIAWLELIWYMCDLLEQNSWTCLFVVHDWMFCLCLVLGLWFIAGNSLTDICRTMKTFVVLMNLLLFCCLLFAYCSFWNGISFLFVKFARNIIF